MSERLVPRVYQDIPVMEPPKPALRVLGLDLGKNCGWWSGAKGGIWKLDDGAPKNADDDLLDSYLVHRLHEKLCDAIDEFQPSIVAYEAVQLHGSRTQWSTVRRLNRLNGIVLLDCRVLEIVADPVSRQSWQGWAKANTDWGWVKRDGRDDADARGIHDYWLVKRMDSVIVGAAA